MENQNPCSLSDLPIANSKCEQCGKTGDLTYKKCSNPNHGYMGGFAGCLDCYKQCYGELDKTPCDLDDLPISNSTCVQCGKTGDLTYKKCMNSNHGYMGGFAGCLDCYKQCYSYRRNCILSDLPINNSICEQCGKTGDLTYKKCYNADHGYMGGFAGCSDCWKQCSVVLERKPCQLDDVYIANSNCVKCGKVGDLTYKKCSNSNHGYMGGFAGCVDCYEQCYYYD
jgi:hypothetical protein